METTELKSVFTKEELKTLLLLVSCGEWLINATRTDPIKEIENVEQKFYGIMAKLGLKECFDEIYNNKLFLSKNFEDTMMSPYIDYYNDITFWDELEERLVFRDMMNKYGIEKFNKMQFKERIEKEYEFSDKYNEEFSEHGVENIFITKKDNK